MTEAPSEGDGGAGAAASESVEASSLDRWIVRVFAVYTALLVIAAWAQWTDNRAVLSLLDLRRLFR